MYWNQFRILKITQEKEVFYKVFFTHYKDEWRLNSGISSYEEKDKFVTFKGYSGSSHSVGLEGKDSSHWSWDGILKQILSNPEIEVIPYEQFKEEFHKRGINKEEEGSC
jgi:hypothetical protein